MATRPRKPTPEPAPETGLGDPILAVLDELRALRQDVNAFRDEVRALAERRAEQHEQPGVDPGDAVPPGVAVQEPAPLTEADRKAKRSLSRLSRRR
jgi:hypothetical protein